MLYSYANFPINDFYILMIFTVVYTLHHSKKSPLYMIVTHYHKLEIHYHKLDFNRLI